jgi:hypothetical protein
MRRIIPCIIYIILGIALFVLGALEIMDSFWGGMGGALIAIGVIRAVQLIRLRKSEAYREKMEIEMADERNRFIRNRAWAWAGYLFVLIAAVSTIGLKLMGQDILSVAAGCAVCILVLLYWISYLILRKKY